MKLLFFMRLIQTFRTKIRWISGVTDLCQRKYGDIVKTKGPITDIQTFLKCL